MSEEFTLTYGRFPAIHGFRFELFCIAYDEYTEKPYDWELYSFSARPTKKQIRRYKSKFNNRINGRGI